MRGGTLPIWRGQDLGEGGLFVFSEQGVGDEILYASLLPDHRHLPAGEDDPGKPFPSSPLAIVNSPVVVAVNGSPAEVLAAVGLPGTVDGYQVNFRVPKDAASGSATVQVTAAWIAGPTVSIPIQ